MTRDPWLDRIDPPCIRTAGCARRFGHWEPCHVPPTASPPAHAGRSPFDPRPDTGRAAAPVSGLPTRSQPDPRDDSRDPASDYGRLLAERDRLIAGGADPAELELPDSPGPER